MRRLLFITSFAFFLSACDGGGTEVYNKDGTRTGRVSVASETSASIYNRDGNRIGDVKDTIIYNRGGSRVGTVRASNDIVDKDGIRKGKIDGKRCLNRDGYEAGHLSGTIDREAAGGGCLLLLLQ